MRIGINTLFLVPGDVGGTEVYLRENLKEMIPSNPQDTFVLFTTSDNDLSLRQDFDQFYNVEFVRLQVKAAIRPLRIIAEQTILPWNAWRKEIDVLWSPGYTAPLINACPQVVTIHDLQYKTHPEDLSFLERITLDFLVKSACRRCDSIIAVSKFSKSEIVRFNFAPADKIQVIYEGVDPSFSEPTEVDISELLDLTSETSYILCVAHTYPHKNVHLLVEAFNRLLDEIPHHLVLVGKARRGETRVRESLHNISDRKRVHRISNISYEELKAIYQKADVFILPSEYEGFGLPILEALLAGVPVITTTKASLPEVGGDVVKYFYPIRMEFLIESILLTIELDPKAKRNILDMGKMWAQTFTWKISAEKIVKQIKLIRPNLKV